MTSSAAGFELRQALDASGEVMFLTNRDGTFTFVNREFERLYGYTATEVVDVATPRILKGGAVSPDFYRSFWERLLAGDVVRGEFVNRAKNGRLVHVEVSANPVRDDHGQLVGFLGVQRDVTARKQMEAALRESEARYRVLAEASQDAVFIVDSHHRIQYMNAHGAAMLGRRAEEIAGRDLAALFPPEVVTSLGHHITHAIESRMPVYAELRLPLPGADIWQGTWLTPLADATGAMTSLLGVSRDMTEQHRLAEALEQRNRLLGAIVENAPNGVAVLSGPEFVHSVVNPVLLRLLPPNTPVSGRPFAEVWPGLADTLIPVFERVEATGSAEQTDVVWWREAHDGGGAEPAHLTIAVGPIRVAGHESASVLIIVMDTTARRQLEAQVQQAQKMDAVGRLAGGIAHEFNNLMTSVLGYAELVIGTLAVNDPRRADLDQICAAAQSAASLSRQLLTLRQPTGAAPAPLDLNAALGRMERAIRVWAGERTEVSLKLAPGLAPIGVEPDQLEQVVTSLAANAGESMPDGGRLAIETASVTLTAAQHVQRRWMPPGDYVELSIRDTGSGMTPEVRAHLFEPFFTTKPFGQGRGLGLSTVYGIVTMSRGFIAVTSQPGEGSTFTLYFPTAGSR